jgi:hypothetical protein
MTLHEIKRQGNFTCNVSHLNRLCEKVNTMPHKVYSLIGDFGGMPDTVTREAIFQYVADKYNNGNYETIYQRWLANYTL